MALARQLIFSAAPVLLLWLLASAVVSSAADYYDFPDIGDAGVPIYDKSLPSYGSDGMVPLRIAVEGVVSCKNGTKYHPLKGKLCVSPMAIIWFFSFFNTKRKLLI